MVLLRALLMQEVRAVGRSMSCPLSHCKRKRPLQRAAVELKVATMETGSASSAGSAHPGVGLQVRVDALGRPTRARGARGGKARWPLAALPPGTVFVAPGATYIAQVVNYSAAAFDVAGARTPIP